MDPGTDTVQMSLADAAEPEQYPSDLFARSILESGLQPLQAVTNTTSTGTTATTTTSHSPTSTLAAEHENIEVRYDKHNT